jgi:hypothetical protein
MTDIMTDMQIVCILAFVLGVGVGWCWRGYVVWKNSARSAIERSEIGEAT